MNGTGVALLTVEPNVLRTLQFSYRGSLHEGGKLLLDGPRENRLADGHIERLHPGR